MTAARLAGRVAGGSTAPGFSFLDRWDGPCRAGGLRERVDAVPCGGDRMGPRPGRLDFQAAAPPAAHEPGSGVQDPVTGRSVLGSALARSPSRASSFSQASWIWAVIEAVSHAALILKACEGKCPSPQSL